MEVSKVTDEKMLSEALEVRKIVFIDEQNVPVEEEIDEYDVINDEVVIHYVFNDGKTIGTTRILNGDGYVKIGRVALLKEARGMKKGNFMLQKIIDQIYEENIFDIQNKYLYLEAQLYALEFYEKLGFESYGEIFLDAGIEHVKMKR